MSAAALIRIPTITIVSPVRVSAMARLRGAYFGQGYESAARYHIRFDRITRHLWEARRMNRHQSLGSIVCVDDLIHAVACIEDNGLAWVDLAERYERGLIRRCRGNQDEIEATISVRRMIADLRHRSREAGRFAAPTLRSYWGDRPLRTWLADRLSAILARQAIARVRDRRHQSTAPAHRAATFQSNRAFPSTTTFHWANGGAPLRFIRLPDSVAG